MVCTSLDSLLRPLFYFLCSNLKANPVHMEASDVLSVLLAEKRNQMQYSSSLCTPKPSRRTLYHKQQPNFPAAIRNRSLPWEEEVEGYVRTKRSPFTCRMPVIQLPSLPISLQPSKGWVDEEAWQLDNWHPACELVTLHCRMDDIRTLESAESIAL